MIVFAGMIGAGKTTYTEALSERLGTLPFYESVDDNPVLDRFYNNPKKWGFSLQIFFLNKRFKSIKEALTNDNNVLDRSIYEDALFTEINFKQGNIDKVNMEIYNDLLDNMMDELKGMPKKRPDLLIYLHGSFETILSHIKKRGRDYEQWDDDPELLAYYKLLHDNYKQWYKKYDKSPKIMIDIDKFDIINDKEKVLDYIVKEIEKVRQ